MSLRLAASLLAVLFVCATGARPARADTADDDLPSFQLIAIAAIDVQDSVDNLKGVLLLADGGPRVRSVFSLLNNLDARAHEIEVHAFNVLGDENGADIEAIAFIVLMDAARSAQEDLKAIMAGVKSINNAKAQQRQRLDTLEKLDGDVAGAIEDLEGTTLTMLDLFGLNDNCVTCGG